MRTWKKKHKIRMKVDTGANGNIIPFKNYKKMYPRNIVKSTKQPISVKRESITLWAINGTKISHYGSIILKIKHKDLATIKTKFFV